ncbi:hypothetical protein [Pelagicoccus sp. SDUM812003]|uniref:hypothetical protein n=1 Tax=Pelagicoccus sp. SDUM812003 TaxID=3041267 RepID=UPI00280F88EC|nr:hypothetical protein [Pelagicoccus sp. SDUM812003]MDQ8203067.1 hypothetical protein [Pelagicoccus sp. SDUM812003]
MNFRRMLLIVSLSALCGLYQTAIRAAESTQDSDKSDSVIGAEVVGEEGYSRIGTVVGIARGGEGGPAKLYVVKSNALFGGHGLIPLSHVMDEFKVPNKDGSQSYRIKVAINKATFRNIANWDHRNEPISVYLNRMESIFSTLFGLESSTIESFARNLVVDHGSGATSDEAEVAKL